MCRRSEWLIRDVVPHEAWLRQKLTHWSCSPSDIDDVVQDSFVKLLTASLTHDVHSPRALLGRTARNLMIDLYRRRAVLAFTDLDHALVLPSADVPQDEAYDARCALERVTCALDAMSPRRREIIERRRLEGEPSMAVAAALGVSKSAIEKHLYAGVDRLRRAAEMGGPALCEA